MSERERRTILIIDDSRAARLNTTAHLSQICDAWNLIEGACGDDALARVEELQANGIEVDAMLLDINMPGMDGFELAVRLRSKYPHAPISLLSANIQKPVQDRAASLGYHFIAKPLSAEKTAEFVAIVEEAHAGTR